MIGKDIKESESGQYVQYTGTADVREISKSDWRAAGVTHDALRWDDDNAKHIPVEDISEEVWAFIEEDPDLKLVSVSDVSSLRKSASRSALRSHPLAEARAAMAQGQSEAVAPQGDPAGSTAGASVSGDSTVGGSTRTSRTR